jgi:uncharacterized protein (TIGR00296 family)
MSLSERDGEIMIRVARAAVAEYLKTHKKLVPEEDFRSKFSFRSGVFVTLNKNENLRGCIGFPTPEKELHKSLIEAAIASATEDPRFLPVKYEELNDISFEVTVLTPPVEIMVENFNDLPSKIKIGRDGLIVKWEFGSGLLLPQVPVEYGWNEEEFLSHTCEKADAPSDCWKREGTKILRFEGIVFKETKPNGNVIQVQL